MHMTTLSESLRVQGHIRIGYDTDSSPARMEEKTGTRMYRTLHGFSGHGGTKGKEPQFGVKCSALYYEFR